MKIVKSVKPVEHEWGLPRLFDEFFSDKFFSDSFLVSPLQKALAGSWTPAIDVMDTDHEIKIRADLPGMEEKDIQLEFHNGYLTISGEKKEEKEEQGKHSYRLERRYGSFTRTIPVGENIDDTKAQATYRNGVLTVLLPKTEKSKPKLIKIINTK